MSKWICDRCGMEAGDGILLMSNNRLCWPCHNKSGRVRLSTDTIIRQSVHGETCYEWDCSSCGQGITSTSPEFAGRRCAKCDNKKPDDSHYHKGNMDPWKFIQANNLNFFEGSAVKYITRWRHKNGVEDLKKARVYIDELIRQAERKP